MKTKKLLNVLILFVLTMGLFAMTLPSVFAAAASSVTYTINGTPYVVTASDNSVLELTDGGNANLIKNGNSVINITTSNSIAIKGNGDYVLSEPDNMGDVSYTSSDDIELVYRGGEWVVLHFGDQIAESSEFTITIKFEVDSNPDTKRPAINGQENFVTPIDNPRSVAFFQSYLSAIDDVDGDITGNIYVVNDGYTANQNRIGRFPITFGVKDAAGNETTLTVYVNVVDQTKPVITGSTVIARIGYKETFNINAFKSTLSVTDNVDQIDTSSITIQNDTYTANKSSLGIYSVVFAVKDTAGNEATFTKQIQVIDNVAPTFSGPTVITTSNASILTETDIRKQITANDEIDGNLTSKIKLIEDNYTGNGNKVGSYSIKYQVADNSGNTATHELRIDRLDTIPPVFMIKDGVSILVDQNIALTKEQIVQILTATKQLTVTAQTQVSFTYNEYFGNEANPGVYAVSLLARSTNGNESIHNLAINVLSAETPSDNVDITPKDNLTKMIPYIVYGVVGIAVVCFVVIIFKKKK